MRLFQTTSRRCLTHPVFMGTRTRLVSAGTEQPGYHRFAHGGGTLTEPLRPVVIGPNEGETIDGPVGGPLTFKVRGQQTNGALTAFENVIPPGQGPPLHSHGNEDECWYVLEGDLRFKLDGDIRQAPAGSFVFVPRGTPHCFQ